MAKNHQRSSYHLLDLLGDLGGIFELLTGSIGLLMFKVSEHSFILKALKNLFMVNTSDEDIFGLKEGLRNHNHKHHEHHETNQ